MKHAFILILMSIFLCSCEDEDIKNGRELYKLYFKEILKDPESLKIYHESYKVGEGAVEWELDYGAKNSFNGMVRETINFRTLGNTIYINGKSYHKNDFTR